MLKRLDDAMAEVAAVLHVIRSETDRAKDSKTKLAAAIERAQAALDESAAALQQVDREPTSPQGLNLRRLTEALEAARAELGQPA